MQTQDSAKALLAAYAQQANVPGLHFSPDGCARLLFEDSVAIDLEIDDAHDCIQMYCALGPVPAGGREALYRSLLEGNLFGAQTGGATLCVDPVQEEVLMCSRVGLATTGDAELAKLLEEFAGAASQWQQKLGSGELVATVGDTAATQSWQGAYLRG